MFLLGLGLSGLQAQEMITVASGNASSDGGSVSLSVGQVVYTTHTGTSGSVAQGVQQPFEISVETSIEEAKGIILSVSAYPNPANDFLTLKLHASMMPDNYSLSYHLFDNNGKLLMSKIIESNETSIPMKELVPAIYYLKIKDGNKEVKTFKIIKN